LPIDAGTRPGFPVDIIAPVPIMRVMSRAGFEPIFESDMKPDGPWARVGKRLLLTRWKMEICRASSTKLENEGVVMNSFVSTGMSANSKGQDKHMSLIESIVNVFIGYILTVLIQCLIYPLFDIVIPAEQALFISGLIVLISFVKNYALRRMFNTLHVNGLSRGHGDSF
jgi:hypothetical protein